MVPSGECIGQSLLESTNPAVSDYIIQHRCRPDLFVDYTMSFLSPEVEYSAYEEPTVTSVVLFTQSALPLNSITFP